ncbi:metallophosphoesterase family protein [Sulfuriroseicoccus oceanibius]|uniref:Metallophosphoesterase family protein n=1 Tax=Sulfuriroseicoccus oceanibius TaxID=2707525 RepID=A0A6B3LFG9_9BACT|nr:metallophosphoesterase family protein [Sulfuriroseicoccus oceanibius]QQL45759.1 metallophosphoesterase family protein [Sulfuriroseicoccus oceanibius]
MKYAIFGDIHANLEALETVLADAKEQGCDKYVCLGDIVGYNANPRECLEIVRSLDCPVIKGNHDEECSRDTPLEGLNPLAFAALTWAREQMVPSEKEYLRNLRFVRQVSDFTVVHATLDSPSSWAYVTNKFDAMASFNYQFTSVCFYGHTHVPMAFVQNDGGRPDQRMEEVVEIKPGEKYFINVGSVGQPRDGDWRASYAIYDKAAKTVTTRRLEYDIRKTQEKILAAGLPEGLADRLAEGH